MTTSTTESVWLDRATRGLEELAECTYDTFRRMHQPPFRALRFGASGVVYAFWKAAGTLDSTEWLNYARLWLDSMLHGPEDSDTATVPESDGGTFTLNIPDSFFDGNRGLYFVQTLVGYAEENPRYYEKGLKGFTAPPSSQEEMQEILQGIGGRLMGCAILLGETARWKTIEPEGYDLREYGNQLADELIDTAFASDDWNTPWQNNKYLGFAHGRAGVYYSLLRWAKETGYRLPAWVGEGLHRYAKFAIEQEHGIRWGAHEDHPDKHINSWCNGSPGQIHLYSLAYDVLGETFFLDTARAAADYCVHQKRHEYAHICCGAAGAAYALLALHRIDPEGPWRTYAHEYADIARDGILVRQWRLSLYNGLAGVVCLMLDMLDPDHAAQPCIEG